MLIHKNKPSEVYFSVNFQILFYHINPGGSIFIPKMLKFLTDFCFILIDCITLIIIYH